MSRPEELDRFVLMAIREKGPLIFADLFDMVTEDHDVAASDRELNHSLQRLRARGRIHYRRGVGRGWAIGT